MLHYSFHFSAYLVNKHFIYDIKSSEITAENAVWLDNGKRIRLKNNAFKVEPFRYGTSYGLRIARFELK